MKIRKPSMIARVVMAAVLATGGVLVAANPAFAEDNRNAVAGNAPAFSSADCIWGIGAETCFEKYGDKVWVYDASADESAAYGYWENWLRDGNKDWSEFYRYSTCENHLGAGKWGYCNYDFYEYTTPNPAGGTGSGLNIWASTKWANSRGGPTWVPNNG